MLETKSRGSRSRARLQGVSGRPTKGGLVQVMMTLDPEQLAALRAEAVRRAAARKSARPDASEVLREIVAAWMKRHTAK